tara:strand:+ start:7711 stop:8010 length:300 start_codon:yes stop_codon:yes gene_type:complete
MPNLLSVDCGLYDCVHSFYQKYLNVRGTNSFKESKYYAEMIHVNILLELIDLTVDCMGDSQVDEDDADMVADLDTYISKIEEITGCEPCCDEGDTSSDG